MASQVSSLRLVHLILCPPFWPYALPSPTSRDHLVCLQTMKMSAAQRMVSEGRGLSRAEPFCEHALEMHTARPSWVSTYPFLDGWALHICQP